MGSDLRDLFWFPPRTAMGLIARLIGRRMTGRALLWTMGGVLMSFLTDLVGFAAAITALGGLC